MPDTLSREEIAAIRDRSDANRTDDGYYIASSDRRDLLAHIDALTAAVEGLEPEPGGPTVWIRRAAVLAILRGEQ